MPKTNPTLKKRTLDRRDDHLGHPDVVPAEEFTCIDGFGEFPEWHPGDVESDEDETEEKLL